MTRAIISYEDGQRFDKIADLIDEYYPQMNDAQVRISERILKHKSIVPEGIVQYQRHMIELLGYIELLQFTCLPLKELFEEPRYDEQEY